MLKRLIGTGPACTSEVLPLFARNLPFQSIVHPCPKHGDRRQLANVAPTRGDRRAEDIGRASSIMKNAPKSPIQASWGYSSIFLARPEYFGPPTGL